MKTYYFLLSLCVVGCDAVMVPPVGLEAERMEVAVVFASFADDAPWQARTEAHRAWEVPGDATALIPWIIEPSHALHDSSLTAYFTEASSSRLLVTGDARYQQLKERSHYAIGPRLRTDLVRADVERGSEEVLFIVIRDMAGLTFTPPGAAFHEYATSTVFVRYNNAGNIIPAMDLIRLLAHETMHHPRLWGPSHIDSSAFVLMGGVGHAGGSVMLSEWERFKMGWSTPELVDCGSDTCVYSDLQRRGHFSQIRHSATTDSDHGLMTTGRALWRLEDGRLVPRDGSFKLSRSAADYVGDLY